MKHEIVEQLKTVGTISVRGCELIDLIKRQIKVPNEALSHNIRAYVWIPSGGDYSGQQLELDNETTLNIQYEILETKTK